MLKHIDLQLFAEEGLGVNEPVAAEQDDILLPDEDTPQETTETQKKTEGQETKENQQTQENTGVEQQPAAGANGGVEKAFAARLAKMREQIEAELRQKYEAELNKHKPTLSYLEQKAQRLGLTVEQLIENDRKWEEQQALNDLIQKNIPEEYAKEMLENRKFREQYQIEKQQREQKEKEQKMYLEFLEAYPNVKPEEVPVEVWQEVAKGRNLLDAYIRYENQKLKAEMAKYQQQQQNQQANQANAASSTGSARDIGSAGKPKDPFEEGFDDEI